MNEGVSYSRRGSGKEVRSISSNEMEEKLLADGTQPGSPSMQIFVFTCFVSVVELLNTTDDFTDFL